MMVNQKTIYKFKPLLKMKKLVLTALAVVAFSGVSKANTVEAKEVQKEKNEVFEDLATNILTADIKTSECSEIAGITVDIAESDYHLSTGECFDSWTWNYIYQNALHECEEGQ
jgi:hypothetical protein